MPPIDWNSFVFGMGLGILLVPFTVIIAMICDSRLQVWLRNKAQSFYEPAKPPYQRHPSKKRVDLNVSPDPIPDLVSPTGKTGRLVFDGRKNLGLVAYDWWKCVDCLSVYPSLGGHPSCNRTPITLCPWCRPDSKPNCYGRGN